MSAQPIERLGSMCKDGGTCHHHCATECFRKDGCCPFSDSGLDSKWRTPEEAAADEAAALQAVTPPAPGAKPRTL